MTRARSAGLAIELVVLGGVAFALTFWAEPPSRLALIENSLLRWMLFSIPYLLFVGRKDLPRLVVTRIDGALLLLIVVASALARFSLKPLPYHPFNWMNDLVGRVATEPDPSWYANGYGIFMWLFTLTGVSPERAIFLGNQTAGALTPLAVFGVVLALGGSRSHALWSALLLALSPLHARLSASETMQVIPALFLLVAVLGFRGHARTGSRPLLIAGAFAFSYACLTRPDASVAAIALPLLYLSDRPRLRDPWLWVCLLLAAGIGGPLVARGALPHGAMLVSPAHALRTFVETLRSAGSPHPLLAGLSVLGILIAISRRQLELALVPATVWLSFVMLAGFENHADNRLQLMVAQLPWMTLAAGAVPAAVTMALPRFDMKALGAAALIAEIVALTWFAPFWEARGPMQEEWLFFERAVPALTTSGLDRLVRPQRPDFSPDYIGSFPDYRLASTVRVGSMSDVSQGKIGPPFAYYRSIDCAGQDACTRFEAQYLLSPLATTQIGDHEIGLFRATAR